GQLPCDLEGPRQRRAGPHRQRAAARQGGRDRRAGVGPVRMRLPIVARESLDVALRALRANKARGALTTLGIIIGIVAVVVTMTAANGLQNKFRESFSAVGADVLYVSRSPWIVMNDFVKYRNRPGISMREATPLEQRFD